jgi:hypothetical protein
VSHRARLDVPAPVLRTVTRWIAGVRRRPGARPWQRAAPVHAQVLLGLRWLRHRIDLHGLARNAQISDATAYRYLHEALDVIAAHAPDLHQVVAAAHAGGAAYLCLDATPVPTDRVAPAPRPAMTCGSPISTAVTTATSRCSATPPGFRCGTSEVRPGSVHHLSAARELVLPTLYPHAARGLPVLADKGYTGAGIGVHTPVKRPVGGALLHPDTRCYNRLLTTLRAPTERAHALLGYWRALHRITVCPWRIGAITAAALVLLHHQHGRTT